MDSIAARVQSSLRDLGARFEVIDIDPDLADTAAFCAHYGYSPDASANAILVASKRPPGQVALCLVLATTRLDVNRRVRDLLGVKKLSFASPEITLDTTGMMIGGVTPFALPESVPIFVDDRIRVLPDVIVGGGDRATKILVDPQVFTQLPNARFVEDLAHPFDPPPAESA